MGFMVFFKAYRFFWGVWGFHRFLNSDHGASQMNQWGLFGTSWDASKMPSGCSFMQAGHRQMESELSMFGHKP